MRRLQGMQRANAAVLLHESHHEIELTESATLNRRKKGHLSSEALSILEDWLVQHFDNPCEPPLVPRSRPTLATFPSKP